MKRKLIHFLSMLAFILLLLPPVNAEAFSGGLSGSITVDYPYVGSEFYLYRVADVSADGSFIKTGSFSNVPMNLAADSCTNPAIADTLAGYVTLWNINPQTQASIGWDNTAVFSGLSKGLYLIRSNSYTVNNNTYTAKPVLVAIPSENVVSGDLYYDVTVSPKPGIVPPAGEPMSLKVLKVWEDSESPNARPPYITVYLFCDGELYDSVVIKESDNWRWSWDELESGHVWSVVEDVVKYYTVSVEQIGNTFVITNSLDIKPVVTPVPTPTPSYNPSYPQLPQTGQLWWPVPVLAGLGFLLLMLGCMMDRSAKDER